MLPRRALFCLLLLAIAIHPVRAADVPRLEVISGHRAPVAAVLFIPPGVSFAGHAGKSLLLSGGEDGLVKLWDLTTGFPLQTFSGFGALAALAIAPDGSTWAAAGRNHLIVRETATGRILWEYPGGITHLQYGNQGGVLLAGRGSYSIMAFDPRSGDLLQARSGRQGSREGSTRGTMAIAPNGDIAHGHNNFVALYESATFVLQREIFLRNLRGSEVGLDTEVRSLAFSADGKWLFTGQDDDSNHKSGGAINCWSLASGTLLYSLPPFQTPIRALAVAPDGSTLAVAQSDDWKDGAVKILDLPTGKPRCVIPCAGGSRSIAYSPDGQLVAAGTGVEQTSGSVLILNAHTGQVVRTLSSQVRLTGGLMHFAGDRLVCSGDDGALYHWDVAAGRLLERLPVPTEYTTNVTRHPDGRLLAAGIENNCLRLWDVRSGKRLFTLATDTNPQAAYFTDGGRRFVALRHQRIPGMERDNGPDSIQGMLCSWDTGTGRQLKTIVRRGYFKHFRATSDGKILVGESAYDNLQRWDLVTGRALSSLPGPKIPDPRTYHSYGLSPDGAFWCFAETSGGTGGDSEVGFDEAENANEETIEMLRYGSRQPDLWIINTRDGRRRKASDIPPGYLTTVAHSTRGKLLAVAAEKGEVVIIELATGKVSARVAPAGDVLSMEFHNNDRTLAVCGDSGAIRLVQVATGRVIATLQLLARRRPEKGVVTTEWIVTTPTGYYEASPGAAAYMWWRVGDQLLPGAQYEAALHKPELVRQALREVLR